MQVVAECVETREQADLLEGLGCDLLQGFLFGQPLQHDDVDNYLTSDNATREGDDE